MVNGQYYQVTITSEQYSGHETNYYVVVDGEYV